MAREDYTPRHGGTRRGRGMVRATVARPVVGSALAVGLLATVGATMAQGEAPAEAATVGGSARAAIAPAAVVPSPTAEAADADRVTAERREGNASRSAAREAARVEAKKKADAKKAAEAKKKAEAKKAADAKKKAAAQKKADAEARIEAIQKDPKPYAVEVMRDAGFGDDQWGCLEQLWVGESNWEWDATNASSGAYGIPQSLPAEKMATAGDDWKTNPITQVKWGVDYIKEVYGSPCGALNFWQSQSPHWY